MKKILILLFSIIIVVPLYSYTYEDLLSSMEMNNTQVLKSVKDYEISSLDVKDAKAAFQPTISAQLSASHLINPMEPVVINTSDISPSLPSQVLEIYPGQESSYYRASLSIVQPIFTWLKLTDAVDIYKNLEQIASINMNDVSRKLTSELNTRLTMDVYLTKVVDALDKQIKISNELLDISKQSRKIGLLTDLDVLNIEIEMSKISSERSKIVMDKDLNMANIRTLVGLDDLTSSNIQYSVDYELYNKINSMSREELKKAAISSTQDSMRMLSLSTEILKEQKAIAENSMYWKPDFALAIDLDYSGARLPVFETDWYGQDKEGGTISIALKTTLWDGGKKFNDVKRAEKELENNLYERQNAINTILLTLDEQFALIDKSLANIEYLKLKSDYYKEKIALENDKLALGSSDKTTILKLELEKALNDLAILQDEISLVSAYYLIDYLCN